MLDVRRPDSGVASDRSVWVWPAIIGAAVLWTFAAAASGGGAPVPMAASIVGVGAAFLIGTGLGGGDRRIVPAVIVVTGLIGLVISTLPALGKGATAGITAYWNATAAFAVQGIAGSLALAFLTRGNGARAAAALAALAFAAVPFLVQSRAAALGVILVGGAALAGGAGVRGRRVTIGALGLVLMLVLAVTLITGFLGESTGPLSDLVGSRRMALWNDAARAIERTPITGIGPGQFESVSALARSDKDLRWAHHDFLQQGAETGIPGMLLVISMFGWGLVRLWRVGDRVAVLTSGGLVALGLQASVDFVLHFPVVTIAAAALVGNASRRGPVEGTGSAMRFMRRAGKAATLPLGVANRRGSGDVAILLYHRVGAGTGEISLPKEEFEEQIVRLAEHERVLTLDQAVDGDGGGVVVTFDDGYRDFHEHALPILVRHGVPATLYLATGLVANGSSPSPEALTWNQLAEAASTGLVTIGSHTHGHADLSRVSESEAEDEMRRSRDLVEDRLSTPCGHFAYPWAVSSAAADRAARRTFRTAALEAWRTNRRGRIDPYRLGRTPVLRSDGPFFFRAKVAGMLDGEALVYRALRRGPWRP